MIRLISILSFLFSVEAFAHIEKGDYKGHDQYGKSCSFSIGETWFVDEFEHPLTERVEVSKLMFGDFKPEINHFQAGHPPVVNLDSGIVRFNHDIFQDIMPTNFGATSVTILKAKEESINAPVGIIYIEDNYKNKTESKKLTCLL